MRADRRHHVGSLANKRDAILGHHRRGLAGEGKDRRGRKRRERSEQAVEMRFQRAGEIAFVQRQQSRGFVRCLNPDEARRIAGSRHDRQRS